MNWFRFYHEALDDPKVQRLSPVMFKNWINLLCLASKSQPRGIIPPLNDVCFSLRVSEPKAIKILDDFVTMRLMDHIGNGRYAPHNWEARQKPGDSSAARVQRYRERQANNESTVTGNATETLLKHSGNGIEIEIEEEIEKEEELTPPNPQGGKTLEYSPAHPSVIEKRFDRFWQAYPKKIGKTAALKSWSRIKPGDAITDQILLAIDAQKEGREWVREDGRFIPNPATWLNQGRWEDEVIPATARDRSKVMAFTGTFKGRDIGLTDAELEERIARGESA